MRMHPDPPSGSFQNRPLSSPAHFFRKKSRISGPPATSEKFRTQLEAFFQSWHALCNNPCTTQFWGPWYRQAGESPSLHPGLIPLRATGPTSFGDPGTGRPGISSFDPGSTPPRVGKSQLFRGPRYRQAETPLFTSGAHTAGSDEPRPFREPWYRQARDSLFNRRDSPRSRRRVPNRSGSFGTGRPEIPSFIPRGD
ncbi:hypothetical protein PF66_01037 [Pseudomonas asplenii]|uniref:Uncharacterized protein n=1 Tax=Pseudomonas asplenii TaxID=53407 RepID=A0A0N0E5D6_9PSED|nr:hypothetical protein PF66_01037 [Pseudomonas fuscovaginae]